MLERSYPHPVGGKKFVLFAPGAFTPTCRNGLCPASRAVRSGPRERCEVLACRSLPLRDECVCESSTCGGLTCWRRQANHRSGPGDGRQRLRQDAFPSASRLDAEDAWQAAQRRGAGEYRVSSARTAFANPVTPSLRGRHEQEAAKRDIEPGRRSVATLRANAAGIEKGAHEHYTADKVRYQAAHARSLPSICVLRYMRHYTGSAAADA